MKNVFGKSSAIIFAWEQEIEKIVNDNYAQIDWVGDWNGCKHIHTECVVTPEHITITPTADEVDCGVVGYLKNTTSYFKKSDVSPSHFFIQIK